MKLLLSPVSPDVGCPTGKPDSNGSGEGDSSRAGHAIATTPAINSEAPTSGMVGVLLIVCNWYHDEKIIGSKPCVIAMNGKKSHGLCKECAIRFMAESEAANIPGLTPSENT